MKVMRVIILSTQILLHGEAEVMAYLYSFKYTALTPACRGPCAHACCCCLCRRHRRHPGCFFFRLLEGPPSSLSMQPFIINLLLIHSCIVCRSDYVFSSVAFNCSLEDSCMDKGGTKGSFLPYYLSYKRCFQYVI